MDHERSLIRLKEQIEVKNPGFPKIDKWDKGKLPPVDAVTMYWMIQQVLSRMPCYNPAASLDEAGRRSAFYAGQCWTLMMLNTLTERPPTPEKQK